MSDSETRETPPENPEALFLRASQLHAAGRLEEAKAVIQAMLATTPNHAGALNLLAIIFGQQGDLGRACDLVAQAIDHDGANPIYHRNLCELRRQNDHAASAMEAGRRAVALAPEDLVARMNLAMAEQDALALEAAVANADFVLARDAENGSAHFLKAQVALMQGAFAEGWEEYRWRWKIPGAERPHPAGSVPEWDGATMAGTLLLIADQGFGDMIQFSRFLPWARERCDQLVLACPRDISDLMRRLVPEARVVTELNAAKDVAAYEVFSSLPGLAGTRLGSVPLADGYLTVDPVRQSRWHKRLAQLAPGPNRLVGLVWAGRREHRGDRMRSMPLAAFQPLLALPGVTYIALQKSEPVAQIGRYFGPAPLINLGPELEDFDDTAAVLTELDLLVSVDTSVVHLAGALGRPAHALLPFRPDWRWLLGRSDTPWYESVTLWRDEAPRTRPATVARLAEFLAKTWEVSAVA